MKELICIVCPRGCHLQVDETNGYVVTGNHCEKGAQYGKTELTHPMRTITSTVKCSSKKHPRVPVKTNQPIPKEMMEKVMEEIAKVNITLPAYIGQIVIPNICGTDASVVVTKNMV